MNEENKILVSSGEEFVKQLRSQFDSKGLNDTEKAKDSISFKVKDNKLSIDGLLRVVVLVTGRKGGKFPPVDLIRGWVERKLGITDEKERNNVAFLISRKIAQEGTDIFTGKAKGLEIEIIINDINNDLFGKISVQAALSVTNTVIDAYK